jgi:hypothetical protein
MGGAAGNGGMSEQEMAMVKMVRESISAGQERAPCLGGAACYRWTRLTRLLQQMQAGMESCVAKTVMAGGAGFVLGGAFGLFMSSVGLSSCHSDLTPASPSILISSSDGLRHTPLGTRPANHLPSRARTTPARPPRHGLKVLLIGQELCHDRRSVLRHRVLYRGVSCQKRSVQQCQCGMHHRQSSRL